MWNNDERIEEIKTWVEQFKRYIHPGVRNVVIEETTSCVLFNKRLHPKLFYP